MPDDEKPAGTDDKDTGKTGGGESGDKPKEYTNDKPFIHPETGEKFVPLSISRKHENRAKDNYEARQELDRIKESQKTDSEKALDKLKAAETRATQAEAKATRYEVAAELGIKTKHLKYLTGSTREEIEESAKGILEDFPETYAESDTDDAKKKPTRPKERLRSGAAPDEEPDETDPRKLAAAVPRL